MYNENGLRVKKTVNGVVTDYTLHGKNVVHMTKGNDELHFFYDAQNRPAVVVYNNVSYAYVKNLQGDIVALLNGAGNVVVSYAYDAWGAPIGKSGSMAERLGTVQPFRYRGYVFDEETGLYYLRSRYYNAERCRFVNADAQLKFGDKGNVVNIYIYCRSNPVIYIDPDGNEFRVVGAGVQLDASASVGPLGVGAGIEVIVYWDETMTAGKGPIVAVYAYIAIFTKAVTPLQQVYNRHRR